MTMWLRVHPSSFPFFMNENKKEVKE